ncbi:MAG: hypothetical protein M1834_009266 [Cirrosporium novae-zelandiae]|nr:MAG: hypothetical protein M1834_009266 [Cirrosporium novae-zelandiae]
MVSDARKESSLRPSLEEAYKSSSEDDLDIDEFQHLFTDANYPPEQTPLNGNRRDSSLSESDRYHQSTLLEKAKFNGLRIQRKFWGLDLLQRRWWEPGMFQGSRWRLTRTCLMYTGTLLLVMVILGVGVGLWVYKVKPKDGQSPPWYPTPKGGSLQSWRTSYGRAEVMVKKLSLIEKVNITTGVGFQMGQCMGNSGPATISGFPSLCLQDGPLGIRFADHSTAFPAGITVGSTWSRQLSYERGRALGREFRLKGINVLLGPSIGPLGRMPAGGRNWESFGADPVLQGLGANTILGIQEEGVMATAKHFILNEQEHFRQSYEWGLPNAMSSNIGDRALHEIYLPPFAESIRIGGVASIMCSYQMVNNSYACQNSKLLNGILKDELGFQGFVQSDWLAQRSGVASALAGLDMSMPGDGLRWMDGNALWGPHLTRALLNSSVPLERLNDMVTRIIASWFQVGQDSWEEGPNFSSWTNSHIGLLHPGVPGDKTRGIVNKYVDVQGHGNESHSLIARKVAAEGTVLLKNENNILPLSTDGPSLSQNMPRDEKYRVGIYGEDAGPGKDGRNKCPDRGCNEGTLAQGWGSGTSEFPYLITPLKALNDTFNTNRVQLEASLTNDITDKEMLKTLKDRDLCLVFANSDSGEGYISVYDGTETIRGDRNNLYLQKGGDALISTVANRCGDGHGRTVVIIHAVGPVLMEEWADLPGVDAIVLANIPGQESGHALVDVIFGKVDASGRLPYTIGKRLEDYGPGANILYYPNAVVPQQDFEEGLYIDYRYFDKFNLTPRFDFGFGLSYTTFEFSNLRLTATKTKSPFPSPRPSPLIPPSYPTVLPNPSSAVFPPNFRKLKKYIYPYLSSAEEAKPSGRASFPPGYTITRQPSPAGGGPGGNPSLFETFANVSVTLTNIGARSGKEVVQCYVSFPEGVIDDSTGETIDFPVRVLRGFEKVELAAGESKEVTLQLTRKDLSYWSVGYGNWIMPLGEFSLSVGRSSRDLPLTTTF